MAQIVGDFTEFVKQIIIDENISQGPQGDVGATGPEGPQGIAGVQGNTGDKGDSVTVTDIQSNPDYSITLTFSDGTVFTSDPIRGAKGEQGDIGLQGATGPQGNDGVDGDNLTVTSVTNNNDNTITIVFSDGTSHNTGVVKGDQGNQGEDGPRGIQGIQGIQGIEGQKGEKGDQGQSVHHVTAVGTTDPEGDFQTPGETDTYVMYGDADETVNLGGFEVRNGDDAYSYVVKRGYTGTAQEFGDTLANFTDYAETAETSATSASANAIIAVNAANAAVTASDSLTSVYLGSKTVDPIVDNDGGPLVPGMMYYNTLSVPKELKIYDGAMWNTAVFAATGAVNTFNGREGTVTLNNVDVTGAVGVDLSGVEAGAQVNTVDSVAGKTGVVTLVKADVGLDQVDNTSDINKVVSNATQTALDGKADNATTLAGYGITDADTSAEVDAKIANLVASAPGTLDTLNELANALGDDPNFAATTAAQIGTKQDQLVNQVNIKSINGDTLLGSGDLTIAAGSGGYAAALYFGSATSTLNPAYKTLDYTPDAASNIETIVCNAGETAGTVFLFGLPIDTSVIDAGKWVANLYCSVDSTNGDTRIRYEGFVRSTGGVETTLFTSTSPELTNVPGYVEFSETTSAITVDPTATYGIRLFAFTDSNNDRTVTIELGDGNASYTNTPAATRHDQLRARDKADSHPQSAITGLVDDLAAKALQATTYTKAETDQAIADVIDSAPETLDTLNELAQALGDDPNFATTTANNIATKVAKVASTDNAIVRFDGATGDIQDSSVIVDDNGFVYQDGDASTAFRQTAKNGYVDNGQTSYNVNALHNRTIMSAYGGTEATPASLNDQDTVYRLTVKGAYNGGASTKKSNLQAFVDGTPDATSCPIGWKLDVVNSSGATIDALTIKSNGNFGIGTSTDLTKLRVAGGDNIVKIGEASDTTDALVGFQTGAGTTAYRGGIGYINGEQDLRFFVGSNILLTEAYTKMMLKSSGDIELTGVGAGVIMKSPNGTKFKITVLDDGSLNTEEII